MKSAKADAGNAFRDIVDLFSGRVFNLAVKMLGNRHDAEEAVQDVFMRIHSSLDDFRGESSLSTWIWRITVNVCLTKRKKSSLGAVSLDESGIDPPDGRVENSSRQEKSVYARERREILEGCIALLPPNESAVVTFFYFEELSYEEISDILKLPIGTVSTALHRGRQRLAEMLKERKDEL